MNYQESAISRLASLGYRITKPRVHVLEILSSESYALNAYEIAKKLEVKKNPVDVSTIYRILEIFEKENIVHYISQKNAYIACQDWQCSNQHHCHHKILCKKCDTITEIHIDDRDFLMTISNKIPSWKIENHIFELRGICETCNTV